MCACPCDTHQTMSEGWQGRCGGQGNDQVRQLSQGDRRGPGLALSGTRVGASEEIQRLEGVSWVGSQGGRRRWLEPGLAPRPLLHLPDRGYAERQPSGALTCPGGLSVFKAKVLNCISIFLFFYFKLFLGWLECDDGGKPTTGETLFFLLWALSPVQQHLSR